MSKGWKVAIVVLLIIAILAAAFVFLFVVNNDTTTNILAYWGDFFNAHGRWARAVFFYRAALNHAPENTSLALRLADTYVSWGNYTKAEYTLVNAITNSPDCLDLYLALSKVYVAQDKLLDAEQMLDRISSESVKEKIDTLRPAAPVISPEGGIYNQYIDVTVTCDSGTLYAAVNTDMPSTKTDAYTEPLSLLDVGENKVVAISVGSNGLVSEAVYAGYTIGNINEEAVFEDSAVEASVRELLGISETDTIMTSDLWEITEFSVPEDAQSLADLENFTGLTSLTAHDMAGLDLSFLSDMPSLTVLDLSGCTLSTSNLSAISACPQLLNLNLSGCAITDISAFVNLAGLTELDISNNSISDITALSSLTELQKLNLANNPITSITALNNCLNLNELTIDSCKVSKLSGVADNTALVTLSASDNAIQDISVLSGCTGLTTLNVSGNEISDISVLTQLANLQTVNLSHNKITAVPKFDSSSKLWNIDLSYNEDLTNISGLSAIQAMNYLSLDYCGVTSVASLKNCIGLSTLNVWDDPIPASEVDALEEVGIVVNYNPTTLTD